MKTIIFLVIVFFIANYVITTRNYINSLRQAIKHENSNIGVAISKRTACLKDALQIVKISYDKEVSGIEKLTAGDKLERLSYLGQKYPDLQSIAGYQNAMNQAFSLNGDISAARELLNGNIREYNTVVTSFPASLIASAFGYAEERFVDEENYEENKKIDKSEVDFSQF